VYGENGIGKSSLAAGFPVPIFLNLEDGVGDLDVDSTSVIRSVGEFYTVLMQLDQTEYQTIVVDTIDWLEKLIFAEVAQQAGKSTIEDIGFGKGYQAVEAKWQDLLAGFTYLWLQGRHIVFTCHESIDKFTNPEGDSYNFWRPSLHAKGSGCITEWCDEVFFMRYRTATVKKKEGFGAERSIAVGGKERYIATTKAASHEAKNRLGLPDEIAPTFDAIRPYLPPVKFTPAVASQPVGNIAGVVTDGSSKPQVQSPSVAIEGSPF
jgi:hypothetical protein